MAYASTKEMNYETDIPEYAIHTDKRICGFFGTFRWLSNFFPCKVHFEGLDYPCLENAYQAAKWPATGRHLWEGNKTASREVFTMVSAAEAKKMGRKAPGLNVKEWDEKKYNIMALLVLQKFLMNQTLKEMLLATDDAYLEETNHWSDRYWGVDEDGVGENNLGRILMGVRETIRKNKL